MDDGQENTAFLDVIMLTLAGFVALVIIMFPHINPEGEKDDQIIRSPGNIIVEVFWDDSLNTDVDTWIKAPLDGSPVGYKHMNDKQSDLLRDDLGAANDISNVNREIAVVRGLEPGEYIINLHLYRNVAGVYPVKVKVIVSFQKHPSGGAKVLFKENVELTQLGQELTVKRFRLDKNANPIYESFNERYIKLVPTQEYERGRP